MEKVEFLPVLLASDINVYSMARAFHEEYGIKSLVVARSSSNIIANSKILVYRERAGLDKTEVFLKEMNDIYKKYGKAKKLILIGCADHYVRLIVENKAELKEKFILPYTDKEVLDNIVLKETFYELCEKYNLDYAKTFIYKPEMNFEFDLKDMLFPVVLKASDSVKFHRNKFEGFHKAYFIDTKEELVDTLKLIYKNGYDDNMIIQEKVPGEDAAMYDLQIYVGSDHKVKMMNLGNVVLEEHTPTAIGNNAATITMSDYNEELMKKIQFLMEDIGYEGFADCDLKYDYRDGKYKMFEINIRQGRSHYRVTGGGYNLAKYVVDDYVYHKEIPTTYVKDEYFWHVVPLGVVYKYVKDKDKIAKIKELVKQGKVCDSFYYKEDMCLKRRIMYWLRCMNHYKKYKKYF